MWPSRVADRIGRRVRRGTALAGSMLVITAGTVAVAASPALAGDGPAGFWYGTDSKAMTVTGSGPYYEPVIGGRYGGYIGMIGNWANLTGCDKIVVWSSANAVQANINYNTYRAGQGTGAYYFMGGPGVDPKYTGTSSEAYAWGERQAARTLMDISHVHVKYRSRSPTSRSRGTRPATRRRRTTAGTPCTPRHAAGWPRCITSRRRSTVPCSTGTPPT